MSRRKRKRLPRSPRTFPPEVSVAAAKGGTVNDFIMLQNLPPTCGEGGGSVYVDVGGSCLSSMLYSESLRLHPPPPYLPLPLQSSLRRPLQEFSPTDFPPGVSVSEFLFPCISEEVLMVVFFTVSFIITMIIFPTSYFAPKWRCNVVVSPFCWMLLPALSQCTFSLPSPPLPSNPHSSAPLPPLPRSLHLPLPPLAE